MLEITTKFIGKSIVEIHIKTKDCLIEYDIADNKGNVSSDFIKNLRDIANELEEHNNDLK